MADIIRRRTHVPGLDELLEGGFPRGSSILVSGSPGTGKTIFSLQFLYNGAAVEGETGVYFTFEEKRDSLIEQASLFGWDIEKYEKEGKLKIVSIGTENISYNVINDMLEIIEKTKAKRIIIDSITTLSYLCAGLSDHVHPNKLSLKKFIYLFIIRFRKFYDTNLIFISQEDEVISDQLAQYICDGVLLIDYESLGGNFSRSLLIRKMRKTKNDEDIHPLEISEKGIVIHSIR